ncbi:MAG: lytic murein transglycosylase [Gammaproteobacteria bacterium]|nr:lytic murein transglycosylase [Pseudomonadales bacterium]MCP5345723.1 lytic murein transglycosylase [Pseudomonadales bacterium]
MIRLMKWRTQLITLVLYCLSVLACLPALVVAQQQSFTDWLVELRAEALADGISEATLTAALDDLEPVDRVLELDRSQPEFVQTFTRYTNLRISQQQIDRGRELMREHAGLLAEVQRRYGVQPHYLVSFWALESNFGRATGGFTVVSALATLAYDPRRADFFRQELLTALRIIDAGHIPADRMTGSWAGAMGQLQFMPSTFRRYAVDGDNDGRIDIWNSLPDVFYSAANFLSQSGWRGDERWGREVVLPAGFDFALSGTSIRKTLTEWRELGITQVDGTALPRVDNMEGSIVIPAGASGPAFLVYNNYRTTLVWNRSMFYAISVGHLADRLVGGAPIQNMPANEQALSRDNVLELQGLLNSRGFDAGPVDGILGGQTRTAIRDYQRQSGIPQDGYASFALLETLRN